jgi:hypothetical protein
MKQGPINTQLISKKDWKINVNMEEISGSKLHNSTFPLTSTKLIYFLIRKFGKFSFQKHFYH